MKAIFLTFVSLLFSYLLHGQYREVTITDIENNEAIPFVYVRAVISPTEKFETLTNLEGKIKLPARYDSLILTHISYETLRAIPGESNETTLRLTPKTTTLASVTVYSIDVKEKINHVLKNFSKFYISNDNTYTCTYKETFKVDDSLVRLLQFNLQWWDKEYQTNFQKPYVSQTQVAVESVSFSKIVEGQTVFKGALQNKTLFDAMHLNYYLTGLVSQGKDYTITSIQKTNTSDKIIFDAVLEHQGKIIGTLKDSYFTFDQTSGALLELYTQLVFADNQVSKTVSRDEKIPVTITHKKEIRKMSFIEEKKRLRLSYFEFEGEHEDQIENKTYAGENKLNIYITNASKGNNIAKKEAIDLEKKPIYEYIQNTAKKDPTILLTHDEQIFINLTE